MIEINTKCLIFDFYKRTTILAILGAKIQIFEGTIIFLAATLK